jgi:hypothetical protein
LTKARFEKLSPELQKAYLERGGRIDPDPISFCDDIRWGSKTRYGRQGRRKAEEVLKGKKYKKK